MNRVYKVIWSKAKHCYVVTSEIARSVTKSASSARSAGRKGAAVLAMAALLFTAGGVLGEVAANVTDVKQGSTADVIMVTKDGNTDKIIINDVYHAMKANSDGDGLVIKENYAKKTDAKDNLKVGDDGVISKVTGNDGTTSSPVNKLVLKVDGDNQITMDEKGIKVGTNGTVIGSDGVFAGGDTADAAKAALNANGSIKGAAGDFEVDENGKVTAKGGVDTNGDINAGSGTVKGNTITGETVTDGKGASMSNGTVTGKTLTDGTATISNGNIKTNGGYIQTSGGNVNTQGGEVRTNSGKVATSGGEINTGSGAIKTVGGDILTAGGKLNTSGGNIVAGTGEISGQNIKASGELSGDSLTVANGMTGRSLTLTGGDLDAGAGTIKTTGEVDAGTLNVSGKATVKDLEVKGEYKAETLTSKLDENNYTTINGGNVTSEVNDKVGAVEYTAESIFNKDGSSITARTDVGEHADSTGKSIVGAKKISQYLGDAAEPDASQKNVTRSMVRNGDNFSMEDTAVDGDKSSTVSQNAGERKVTVAEGTKNLNVTENLTNGIVSETNGGAGKTVTLTQGMDGTYKVVTSGTSTEEIGGQKIENYKGLATNITGDETHVVDGDMTTTVTGDSSLSAADIENKASSSIWNHVGEGYNTSWKMTDGKISESIVNGTASNKENTTAEGTKRIITSEEGTGTYNQTATSNNISLKNKAEDTSFTKSESLKGEKTSVTNPNGSSTINQSAESIVNFVKNSKGHTTRTEQSAEDITNTAKNGTITNDANDVFNKGANSVINEVGANQVAVKTDSVKAAYGSDTYTTWDDKGITSNTSGNMSNTVGGDLINTVTGDSSLSATNIKNKASTSITSQIGEDGKVKSEMNAKGITNTAENGTITNTAQTVKTKTGNNTVTSDNGGTTFKNEDAKTPFEEGDERGTKDNTKITGNKVETGKVLTDFAEVANNLDVKGSTTLGRDGNTTLTVNSESTFRDTVKMDKTLEVDGESTFNNKVTITKNGLDVTGGTTTDTLTVTGTSEFADRADFRKDVYMWGNLEVTGETRTDTLYVDHDGYVGGNLNVDGNIETHDAVLSADSRQVVTGRQLYQTNERVDRLDNRIKKVGANAAALAALRPGDFNPDDKFSIAAGFGSYRNANAAALGLFYRPNENVLLSLGTSFGDGENMVNAGVSVKFGRGKSMAERRKEMADEVSSMRDEMRSQDERIAELEEMLKKQSELIEKLSKES